MKKVINLQKADKFINLIFLIFWKLRIETSKKMENYEYLKAQLLLKLYRKGKWGGAHTPLKNLFHMMDKVSIKESKKAVKELTNLDWIQIKISTREEHISLNSHKNKEIKEFILKILKIDPTLLN